MCSGHCGLCLGALFRVDAPTLPAAGMGRLPPSWEPPPATGTCLPDCAPSQGTAEASDWLMLDGEAWSPPLRVGQHSRASPVLGLLAGSAEAPLQSASPFLGACVSWVPSRLPPGSPPQQDLWNPLPGNSTFPGLQSKACFLVPTFSSTSTQSQMPGSNTMSPLELCYFLCP